MEEIVDPTEIIFDDTKEFIENEGHWAKIRLKRDKSTGLGYLDILAGKKNDKGDHCHLGFSFDGKELVREYRGKVNEITRKVTSKLHGEMPDEKIILNDSPEAYRFRISVVLDGPTKKAILKKFEFA